MSRDERAAWEMGSAFHVWEPLPSAERWAPADVVLFGTARQALRGLIRARRWTRLHVPTYFCEPVTSELEDEVEVVPLAVDPWSPQQQITIGSGEAALVVEYFGARSELVVDGGEVVLDRTHHPSSKHRYDRSPDYVVASLRKTMPFPDGAVVWAPGGGRLPSAPAEVAEHIARAERALKAMRAKASYLSSGHPGKDAFLADLRDLDHERHDGLTSAPHPFTATQWSTFDVDAWDAAKAANQSAFDAARTHDWPGVDVRHLRSHTALLCADGSARDRLRADCVGRGIYPIVLWPIERPGVPEEHRSLAERILLLHVDARYSAPDVRRLVATIDGSLAGSTA